MEENIPQNGLSGSHVKEPAIVVLEIGRPISSDVELQLGKATTVISYPRAIIEAEYPEILKKTYNAIRSIAVNNPNITIHLVLSGPLGLTFQLGQLIGLSHYKIQVYQFSGGRYRPVPQISREVMF